MKTVHCLRDTDRGLSAHVLSSPTLTELWLKAMQAAPTYQVQSKPSLHLWSGSERSGVTKEVKNIY